VALGYPTYHLDIDLRTACDSRPEVDILLVSRLSNLFKSILQGRRGDDQKLVVGALSNGRRHVHGERFTLNTDATTQVWIGHLAGRVTDSQRSYPVFQPTKHI
jgi:hypothetical protein